MGIVVELIDARGRTRRGMPDPNGGRFDAAGDFDDLVADVGPTAAMHLPTLRRMDPTGDTALGRDDMDDLISDIDVCLAIARPGAQLRGLLRLRALARLCSAEPGSSLMCWGD